MPLPHLVAAEKFIAVPVKWIGPDKDELGWLRFEVSLDIEGTTVAGLVLSGGTFKQLPDQNVVLELAIREHRRIPLMRAEWRSLKGGHSNQPRHGCQGPWARKRVPATHIHTFDGNWLAERGQMRRGDLPCAEPFPKEPQSFEEFREVAGTLFRIKNIGIVPRPEWRYDLFDEGGSDNGS